MLFGGMSEARLAARRTPLAAPHVAATAEPCDAQHYPRRPSPPLLLGPPTFPSLFGATDVDPVMPPLRHTPAPLTAAPSAMSSLAAPQPPPFVNTEPASHVFQTLCGSPFMSSAIDTPSPSTSHAGLPTIKIDQWSYKAFRAVVVFLVTNRVDVAFEDAVETLACADSYNEGKLRAACVTLVKARLDVDNVVALLIQAQHVREPMVPSCCCERCD